MAEKAKSKKRPTTTINIKNSTRDKLRKIGKFGEDYDDIINRLLEAKGT